METKRIEIEDPPIARALFSDVRFAGLWLVILTRVGTPWRHGPIEPRVA
jgi:hypothetical protein